MLVAFGLGQFNAHKLMITQSCNKNNVSHFMGRLCRNSLLWMYSGTLLDGYATLA